MTHRDLKPENVYLVTDEELGGRERVKLLDFGVAKLSGSLTASLGPRTIGITSIPACRSGATPCWDLVEDVVHCAAEPYLKLVVTRGAAPAADTRVAMRCTTP